MDISIIVPVYNASKYLRECLDSLVNQDFKGDYEIILVNDGSTDNSLSICQEYATKHPNITVLTGENGGVSVARNKAIDASHGDWFFFADADDLMTPDALTTLYQRQQETNADIVLGNVIYLKDGVSSKSHNNMPNEILPKPVLTLGKFHKRALWGYLLPADLVKDNHILFVEGLAIGEDTLFFSRLALCCKTIAFTDKVVYVYRIHYESATGNVNNSVKRIKHFFLAASHLYKLADDYRGRDWDIFYRLIEVGDAIIVIAISQQGFRDKFFEKRSAFYQAFGKGPRQTVIFYKCYALICLRGVKRRIRSIFQRSSQ